jgi:nitroreductase
MFGHPEFDLFEAMYTTRAMRRLKPDPVPQAIIMRVNEAATMSPSNSNRQPWIFVAVTDDAVKQAAAKYYKKAWYNYYLTPQKRDVMEQAPETAEAKSLRSATYLADHIGEAPVLIFACVKKYIDKRREGQPMHGSIYPAVQNLCLAARAYGLGTSITGLHQMYEEAIDKMIGVPAAYKNEVLIPMGYPKGRWGRPARKAAADVTFFNKWGVRVRA